MNTPYEFEDLDDYLHGRMSPSDKAAFEQALADDPTLQQRLEALRAESSVLQMLRREHLLQQLEQWSEESAPEKKTDPEQVGSKTILPRNLIIVLIAGLLVVVIAIVIKIFGFTDHSTGVQPSPPPTQLANTQQKPPAKEPIAQEAPQVGAPKPNT
ncbi:MAG TPA: hypothetical protein DCF33_02840, partial [Saprospirales bacterium]|nr:hypothetical protein [Saprospirales bacterium]